MFAKLAFAPMAALLLFSQTLPAQAEGVVVIEDFESLDSDVGTWATQSSGINVGLSLLTLGTIEGQRSLGSTLGVGALGSNYTILNSGLDVPVPPGIENFVFSQRTVLGVNLGKSVTVTLTDQDNNQYVSQQLNLNSVQLNVLNNFSFPLDSFTPSAVGGVITRLKGISLSYQNGITLAANEQFDSFRFTWDDSGVSHTPHDISVDFNTRVNGPGSQFSLNVKMNPADVAVGRMTILIGYNSAEVELDSVINNTGQAGVGVTYIVGPPETLTGYPNVNTFRKLELLAQPALTNPTFLAQLNFTATETFSDPANRVVIQLLESLPTPGLQDEDWNQIPVTFSSNDTPLPVTLSSYSIE